MDPLAYAILRTVAYSDVFEHPLTEAEIHRYLIEAPASPEAVHRSLVDDLLPTGQLVEMENYFSLPGRQGTLATRRRRRDFSARLWPKAARYGRLIGSLPYVRMVAVTGSLSMDSADSQADLDYLVVTRPGRLWVTRALVILLVRLAARRGDTLCPNYFLSERALKLTHRNLFTAHEMAQMVPLSGSDTYRRMWRLNGWVHMLLPNASRLFWETADSGAYWTRLRPGLEAALAAPAIDRVERWELDRKQRRFGIQALPHPEASFGPDVCKGHFDDHGQRILATYQARLQALAEVQL